MEYNYEMGAGYVNVDAVSYDNINNGDHDYFLKFDGEDTYYPLHVRRKTVGVLGIGNHFFTFWYGDEQQDHYLSYEAESKMVYSNNTLNASAISFSIIRTAAPCSASMRSVLRSTHSSRSWRATLTLMAIRSTVWR